MPGLGNVFQVNFGQVAEIASKFTQQKDHTETSKSTVTNYGPKVQSAWIGGDADEFVADIGRKLVPKYIELALAFTGVQVNLTKASESASSGDNRAAKLASGFADLCSKIF